MATSPAFGRRANPHIAVPRARSAAPVRQQPTAEPNTFEQSKAALEQPHTALAPAAILPSVEDELREWKQSRKSAFQIPWRQISLMASLCFGIASFVLPDSVNGVVNWLLYGLMAASFVVGISNRRKKKAASAKPATAR